MERSKASTKEKLSPDGPTIARAYTILLKMIRYYFIRYGKHTMNSIKNGEVNVRVLGKVLELLSVNGCRFEINQLLFADDTALVADSEEKLCRLVSEFGRVCKRRKLRVNVGKSKVMRYSGYGNGARMHVIRNSQPLEEVDCFSTWGRKWVLKDYLKGM